MTSTNRKKHFYKVSANYGNFGINEQFRYLYFALKAAKLAIKAGAKVIIERKGE